MPWPVTSPITTARRVGDERVDVVEVAGEQAGAGLVDPADVVAGDGGQVVGGEPLGPPLRGQLLLGEHLLGPPLDRGPALEQAGLPDEVAPVDEGQGHRHEDEGVEDVGLAPVENATARQASPTTE